MVTIYRDTSKMTRPHLSILQKIKALDEFKKQSNAKKLNPELGLIARDVLKLDYTPSEATIRRWKLAETKFRDQAKSIKPISKHDRYRRKFEVKNVQQPDTIRLTDDIFDRFMLVLSNKCLSIQIMVDEARLLAREHYPNLSLYGRPGRVMINKRFIRKRRAPHRK